MMQQGSYCLILSYNTPLGKIIRNSLDLAFNCGKVRGEMSFVGPRPLYYQNNLPLYIEGEKHAIMYNQGITGRRVCGEVNVWVQEKFKLDKDMKNQSFVLTSIF